jgi:mannose-6-phosphate isomerase-like protein (cupin superfamily)
MRYIVSPTNCREHRDDRYGSVFTLNVPEVARLKNLDFAFAVVDVGKRSPDHYHKVTEEIYHILDGQGRMYIGDEVAVVGPGMTILIPVSTVHSLENTGTIPLRFIVISSPPYNKCDDHEVHQIAIVPTRAS